MVVFPFDKDGSGLVLEKACDAAIRPCPMARCRLPRSLDRGATTAFRTRRTRVERQARSSVQNNADPRQADIHFKSRKTWLSESVFLLSARYGTDL